MGSPITWRNVDAPNPGVAAPILGQAGLSINNAFDQFSRIIQQRQAVDASNVAAGQDVLKQNFLDALASAKTPEQLATLQSSGQLDDIQAGMGAQTRAAVRGADDARLASVRSNQTAADAFTASQRNLAEQPAVNGIKTLIDAGRIQDAQTALDGATLWDKAPLQQAIHDKGRQMLTETQQDALAPITLDNARMANSEGKLRLTAAQQAAEDAQADRTISQALAKAAGEYVTNVHSDRETVDNVLQGWKDGPIPRRSDGTIMYEGLSPTQHTKINAFLAANKAPSLEAINGGDTKAMEGTLRALQANGRFTAQQIAHAVPQVSALFDTSSKAPVGSDAAAAAIQQRSTDAAAQESADNYGVVATPGTAQALSDSAMAAIKDVTAAGSNRQANYIREVNKMINSGGVEIPDPNNPNAPPIRVLPSPATLASLIRGADQRFWTGGDTWTTTGEITDQIQKWVDSTKKSGNASKAVDYANIRRLRQVYQKDAPN